MRGGTRRRRPHPTPPDRRADPRARAPDPRHADSLLIPAGNQRSALGVDEPLAVRLRAFEQRGGPHGARAEAGDGAVGGGLDAAPLLVVAPEAEHLVLRAHQLLAAGAEQPHGAAAQPLGASSSAAVSSWIRLARSVGSASVRDRLTVVKSANRSFSEIVRAR